MPKTSFEIEYDMYDLTAAGDCTYTGHGYNAALSELQHLDGSECSAGKYAYVSVEAGQDGAYSATTDIVATFSESHSSVGVYFHFADAYPASLRIVWHDLYGNQIHSQTYAPDGLDFFCEYIALNYRRVTITFLSGTPGEAFKLTKIEYGKTFVWDQDDIKECKSTESVDSLSDALSANKLVFRLVDIEDLFNIGNRGGVHNVLQKGQTARAYEWKDGRKIFRGKWFFKKFSSTLNLSTIEMDDYLGLMDVSEYTNGGFFNGVPAGEIIEDILDTCHITDYYIDTETYNTLLYGCLKRMSCRRAMREIVFATDSVIRTTEAERFTITKRDQEANELIQRGQKFSTTMAAEDYISDVTVRYNEYEVETNASKLSEAEYQPGSYTVYFTDPVDTSTIEVTGPATITQRAQLYISFTVSAEGTVKVTGKKYRSNTISVTASLTDLDAGETRQSKSYAGTLMNYQLAARKARSILSYYQLRSSISIDCLAGNHQCGDWVEIENPDRTMGNIVGGIEKAETDLTGGYIEKLTLRGYYKITVAYGYAGVAGNDSAIIPDLYADDYLI